jgi:hypothetical protein
LHLGGAEATFTNTMHSILAGVTVLLFLLAMGFGAFACGKRFRLYSIGTLLTLIVLGAVSGFMAGAQITQQGFTAPPQWFGLIERITIYGSMLWVAVLAIVLLSARILDHKNINNPLMCTQLVNFRNDDYVSKVASSHREACKLVEAGFEHVCKVDSVHVFRKRK